MKKILVVKNGGLGDVVRTSYFAKPLKNKGSNIELYWLTSPEAVDILQFNPYIDFICDNFESLKNIKFDTIYSLDDELDVVKFISTLETTNLVGAFCSEEKIKYTDDVSLWFDMGIHSKYGIDVANRLKKENNLTHSQIFKQIFSVDDLDVNFYYNPNRELKKNYSKYLIGLFPYSGQRWKGKCMPYLELISLIEKIICLDKDDFEIRLYGLGAEMTSNEAIKLTINDDRIVVVNSASTVQDLAESISELDVMISSDSLPLHLAIANHVYTISFFTVTSSAEIDNFGNGCKIISDSPDYCSYKNNADNSTITSEKLFNALLQSMVGKPNGKS